jgi:hypothetical protein
MGFLLFVGTRAWCLTWRFTPRSSGFKPTYSVISFHYSINPFCPYFAWVKLRLTLNELLEREKVSVYRVAKEMVEMGWTRENVYAIAQGRSRPSMESLEALLQALEAILGREVNLLEVISQVRG